VCIVTRVLYVEDNALVREITCELLGQDRREVIAFATAEEGLAEFDRRPFDIVITDVSLPAMSGLSFARQILRRKPTAAVIIASGYPLDFGVEELGPNVRSIIKPFDSAQIDTLIMDIADSGNGG
jgi:CheY-like chemotaxis protein